MGKNAMGKSDLLSNLPKDSRDKLRYLNKHKLKKVQGDSASQIVENFSKVCNGEDSMLPDTVDVGPGTQLKDLGKDFKFEVKGNGIYCGGKMIAQVQEAKTSSAAPCSDQAWRQNIKDILQELEINEQKTENSEDTGETVTRTLEKDSKLGGNPSRRKNFFNFNGRKGKSKGR